MEPHPSGTLGRPSTFHASVPKIEKKLWGDRIASASLKIMATGIVLSVGLMAIVLAQSAYPALKKEGLSFFTSQIWDPARGNFGGLSFLYGTLVSSLGAILLAAPISIGLGLLLTEILPRKVSSFLGLLVEMLAAIPSIIFGLWGVFFLAPWIKSTLAPFLKSTLGFIPLFQGPSFGLGLLTAILILAIMIIPTVTSICRETFMSVSPSQKEGALSLGATRFEMIKLTVLPPSLSGMAGALTLGMGRALGETMAVAMVIGNSASINLGLFSPASTMASVIANEYAEAESDLHISALVCVALSLFVITMLINSLARLIVKTPQKT